MPHGWVEAKTLWYTSPEEIRGEELDARTDLFSFGLVLYEMATGRPAFRRDSMISEMAEIKNQPPVSSVRDLNPDIPRELARIIAKAVQKPRDLRYRSAAEMRADLERLKHGGTKLNLLKFAVRHWKWWCAAIALLIVAIAVAAWLYWR